MKLVKEYLYEGVADKFAEKEFHISNFDIEKQNQYNIKLAKEKETIVGHAKNISGTKLSPIVKNPKDISKISHGSRGIIDDEGNLYIEINPISIHWYIIQELADKRIIPFNKKFLWATRNPQKIGFIGVQKVGNKIILAESYEHVEQKYKKQFEFFFKKSKLKNPKFEYIFRTI